MSHRRVTVVTGAARGVAELRRPVTSGAQPKAARVAGP